MRRFDFIEFRKLAKVFEEYGFFDDDLPVTPEFSVLSEVFNALPHDIVELLYRYHNELHKEVT